MLLILFCLTQTGQKFFRRTTSVAWAWQPAWYWPQHDRHWRRLTAKRMWMNLVNLAKSGSDQNSLNQNAGNWKGQPTSFVACHAHLFQGAGTIWRYRWVGRIRFNALRSFRWQQLFCLCIGSIAADATLGSGGGRWIKKLSLVAFIGKLFFE